MYLAHWDTELLLWRMFRLCSYIKSIALRSGAYGCNESLVQVQVNVQAWMGTLRNIRHPHSPQRHLHVQDIIRPLIFGT